MATGTGARAADSAGGRRIPGDGRTESNGRATESVRERQREEYGGFNIGAAFFGWLVAIGLAALLTALAAAAGAAVGLSQTGGSAPTSPPPSAGSIGTVDIIGAVVVGLVLFLAYLCGGYVAGRMARFDGARQGLGVWLIGIVIAIVLAVLAAILGSEFNVLAQLNLPRIPIDEGSLATGGLIALGAWLLVTLLGAILGGKLGERYHRKVDRVGVDRPGPGR
jgi:hypothetical protein